ncbi:MAG TPA: hypothetical protein VMD79_01975 [Solirubrobacteraceae bacterium]|nr:hypothetical protein [Solirubrobacteraceae bacterium]
MASAPILPEWVYVFVSPHNPMAVMNLQITGRYTSPALGELQDPAFAASYANGTADFLPFVPNPSASIGFMSPFAVGTINGYRVEYDAELTRRAFFKNAPSRLTGIYAFDSLETCKAVNAEWGQSWPLNTVQRFKVESAWRTTRVNMEIVSLARHAYARAMLDQEGIERLWRAYWSGADNYSMDLPSVDAKQREVVSAGTTWEWIIDGVLVHESRVDGAA